MPVAEIFSQSSSASLASPASLQALLSHPDSLLSCQFFAPLLRGGDSLPSFMRCPVLPDQHWLLFGVLRSLRPVQSGRAFLQKDVSLLPSCPEPGHFFETLKSKRRLAVCSEAATALSSHLSPLLPDALAEFPALDGFDVWAGDGHHHSAAAHDPRDSEGRKHPEGHLFMLSLRLNLIAHLTVGAPAGAPAGAPQSAPQSARHARYQTHGLACAANGRCQRTARHHRMGAGCD